MNLLNFIIENLKDEKLKQQLKITHPKQVIYTEPLNYQIYKINYEYDTVRNNHKDNATKLIIKQKSINRNTKQITDNSMKLYQENIIKNEFMKYIKKFNNEKPNRSLLNVKILSVEILGENILV